MEDTRTSERKAKAAAHSVRHIINASFQRSHTKAPHSSVKSVNIACSNITSALAAIYETNHLSQPIDRGFQIGSSLIRVCSHCRGLICERRFIGHNWNLICADNEPYG